MPGIGLSTPLARSRWLVMWASKILFGYGHSAVRVFSTLLPLWAALTLFFGATFDRGQFAPNSDVIQTSQDWTSVVETGCLLAKAAGCQMPLTLWAGDLDRNLSPAHAVKDCETFGRWLCAANLFLPLDTIGQTEAWAPPKDRGWWGWTRYYLRFPVQLFGRVIVAMAAAILTGLIGKRDA